MPESYKDDQVYMPLLPDEIQPRIEEYSRSVLAGDLPSMRATPVEDQPELSGSYFLVKGTFTEGDDLDTGWSVVRGEHWTYIPGRGFAVVSTPFGSRMVSDFDMYHIEIEDELNRINNEYAKCALQEQLEEIARREQAAVDAEPIAVNIEPDPGISAVSEVDPVPGRFVILGPISERTSQPSTEGANQEHKAERKPLVESAANYLPHAIGAVIVGAGIFAAGTINFRKRN